MAAAVGVMIVMMLADLVAVIVVMLVVVMFVVRVLAFIMVMLVAVGVAVFMRARLFVMMVFVGVCGALRVVVMMVVAMPVFVLFRFVLAVRVGLAFVDAKFDSLDFVPLLALKVHVKIPEIEFGKLPFERGGFHTKIDQCADGHVAGDAGKAVKKKDFHGIIAEVAMDAEGGMNWNLARQVRPDSGCHRKGLCR